MEPCPLPKTCWGRLLHAGTRGNWDKGLKMLKKLALIMAILMIAFLAFSLFGLKTNVSVSINGREITGPLGTAVGLWGTILAAVVLFCVAILLAFVFAGVGLVIVGCLVLVGIILIAIALPFLLPLIIPLFIVWAFCAIIRSGKEKKDK